MQEVPDNTYETLYEPVTNSSENSTTNLDPKNEHEVPRYTDEKFIEKTNEGSEEPLDNSEFDLEFWIEQYANKEPDESPGKVEDKSDKIVRENSAIYSDLKHDSWVQNENPKYTNAEYTGKTDEELDESAKDIDEILAIYLALEEDSDNCAENRPNSSKNILPIIVPTPGPDKIRSKETLETKDEKKEDQRTCNDNQQQNQLVKAKSDPMTESNNLRKPFSHKYTFGTYQQTIQVPQDYEGRFIAKNLNELAAYLKKSSKRLVSQVYEVPQQLENMKAKLKKYHLPDWLFLGYIIEWYLPKPDPTKTEETKTNGLIRKLSIPNDSPVNIEDKNDRNRRICNAYYQETICHSDANSLPKRPEKYFGINDSNGWNKYISIVLFQSKTPMNDACEKYRDQTIDLYGKSPWFSSQELEI